MDKIDMLLNLDLINNSRTPYRTLAEKHNLSVNAVHKRITNNIETGIIKKFTAKISLTYLNAFIVIIFGKSNSTSINDTIKQLGAHTATYQIVLAGGNFLYVSGYLKDISDLNEFSTEIIKTSEIENPTIGIHTDPIKHKKENDLKKLDYKIIYALKENSRKSIHDIADELQTSSKTVTRHLSKMIKNNAIELSLDFYPTASNDMFTICHLSIKKEESEMNITKQIVNEFYPRVIGAWTLSNIPKLILMNVWTNTIQEIHQFEEEISQREYTKQTFSNLLYDIFYFDTWRDDLLKKKAEE